MSGVPPDGPADSPVDVAPRRSAARALGWVCAGLVVGAAALWGGSVAVWLRTAAPASTAGPAPAVLTGAQVSAAPAAVALLALAGVAGVVATAGAGRRAVGGLLAAGGAAAAVIAARAWLGGTDPSGSVTAAPSLALAGGALLLVVGLFVLVREPRLARLGARYGTPRDRVVDLDPDRAAWQDLDAGRDPTVDVPGDRGDDPGDSEGNRAV